MKFLDTKEKKVGFYSTIIFHLVVLIIFLLTAIKGVVSEEVSFVLDFSNLEKIQEQEKILEIKEQASKELEELLQGKQSTNIRNVAVDRSDKHLRDDRFKNPNQVYDEAKELQKKLDASRKAAMEEQGADDVPIAGNNKKENKDAPKYKGPSVISYSLSGRKAINLPVPVYKCMGGGDVSVMITVDKRGYVVGAKVIEAASSADDCLRKAAIDAAKRSRFNASDKASAKQVGEIVYRFIRQ
jgi:Gram-negative bacterial tonB protein.